MTIKNICTIDFKKNAQDYLLKNCNCYKVSACLDTELLTCVTCDRTWTAFNWIVKVTREEKWLKTEKADLQAEIEGLIRLRKVLRKKVRNLQTVKRDI